MHPAIIQAAAAARTRDQHAHAITCRAPHRPAAPGGRGTPQGRSPRQRTGRGLWVLRAPRAA